MTAYAVVNATASAINAIDGASLNAPAYSVTAAPSLTAAQVAALCIAGVAVTGTAPTDQQKRLISKVLRLGKNPNTA